MSQKPDVSKEDRRMFGLQSQVYRLWTVFPAFPFLTLHHLSQSPYLTSKEVQRLSWCAPWHSRFKHREEEKWYTRLGTWGTTSEKSALFDGRAQWCIDMLWCTLNFFSYIKVDSGSIWFKIWEIIKDTLHFKSFLLTNSPNIADIYSWISM